MSHLTDCFPRIFTGRNPMPPECGKFSRKRDGLGIAPSARSLQRSRIANDVPCIAMARLGRLASALQHRTGLFAQKRRAPVSGRPR